jgi:hypothetical protein
MFHLKLKQPSFILLQVVIFGLSLWSTYVSLQMFQAQNKVDEFPTLYQELTRFSTPPSTLFSETPTTEDKITSDVNKNIIPFTDITPDTKKKYSSPPMARKRPDVFPRHLDSFKAKTDETIVFPSKREDVISFSNKVTPQLRVAACQVRLSDDSKGLPDSVSVF